MRILIHSYEIWIYDIINYISITSITKILSQSNCMSNANITTYLTNLFQWIFTVSRRYIIYLWITLYIAIPQLSQKSHVRVQCLFCHSGMARASYSRGYFATADVFSYDFKEFSYRSEGPLFRYSTLFVDDTMRPLLSSLLERDVLKLASSLDWRITLFFFGGCDCHEGSRRSKCFRIALEGPPSFVRLLFVLFVDEERVSPFYTRIL